MENFSTSNIPDSPDMILAKSLIKSSPREYFAIAPMVDLSDRHFRFFIRLLT